MVNTGSTSGSAGCGRPDLAQTGIGRSVDIEPGGRFSFTTPRLPFKTWSLSMVVTDARFVPLDKGVVDSTFVPDERF